jgi:hypothetical protein
LRVGGRPQEQDRDAGPHGHLLDPLHRLDAAGPAAVQPARRPVRIWSAIRPRFF